MISLDLARMHAYVGLTFDVFLNLLDSREQCRGYVIRESSFNEFFQRYDIYRGQSLCKVLLFYVTFDKRSTP